MPRFPGARSSAERGFVLLAALWLLLLGAIIAASIMASGLSTARRAARGIEGTRERLAASSALEQATYDLLVNGRYSRWAGASRSASVTAGATSVIVRSSDEERRVDLNHATPEVLEELFRRGGVSSRGAVASARAVLSAREQAPFRAISDMLRVEGPAGDLLACRVDGVTVYSGMTEPRAWRGNAQPFGDGISGSAESSLYRLSAQVGGRTIERRVLRVTGDERRPIWVLERLPPIDCRTGSASRSPMGGVRR